MSVDMMKRGESLLYHNGSSKEFVRVIFKDENFWLTQKTMAALYDCTADNISLHLKNTFSEAVLHKDSGAWKFSVTAADRKNYLREKELSRLNRLITMFIDYAELMAEGEQFMSMRNWLDETDRLLTSNVARYFPVKAVFPMTTQSKKSAVSMPSSARSRTGIHFRVWL